MKIARIVALALTFALCSGVVYAQGQTAPKDARLYFITPHDGSVVRGVAGSGSACATWGLPMPATIIRTAAIITC